jgi:hypothetical protein
MKPYLNFALKTIVGFFKLLRTPEKLTLKNIKAYFQGNLRLLRIDKLEPHLKQQFFYRLTKMDEGCVRNKMCPCECPAIAKQLSDEPCEKNCYIWMLDKEVWNTYCEIHNLNLTAIEFTGEAVLRRLS